MQEARRNNRTTLQPLYSSQFIHQTRFARRPPNETKRWAERGGGTHLLKLGGDPGGVRRKRLPVPPADALGGVLPRAAWECLGGQAPHHPGGGGGDPPQGGHSRDWEALGWAAACRGPNQKKIGWAMAGQPNHFQIRTPENPFGWAVAAAGSPTNPPSVPQSHLP